MTAHGPGVAVVVGATGTLGLVIVRRLRACNVPVIALARDVRPLAELTSLDDGVIACSADIATADVEEQIRAAVPGPVRMVVQAAGLPAAGPVDTVDPEALGAGVALKVGGLLRLVRAVDDRLGPGSRVVALGGHYGSEPAPYASLAGIANAALANAVRQLAISYGPRGVTVHLIAPGPVDSPRLHRLLAGQAERLGLPLETLLEQRRAESPLGRLITPDEVAWAVGILLDPQADALHGSALALDMGARRGLF
ncbi:MAG: SDR family oxidoreductase [Actinomycetota bacterium]|nr:SDR family oxidoreductase [Actinomycetota bacterium]